MTEDFNPPTVSITSPIPGANVRGLVTIAASAWDDIGIKNVAFYANGVAIGQATGSPYKVLWNSTAIANGPVTITAHAVDTSGNESLPSMAHVTVTNPVDTTPPVPMVISPDDGATIAGMVEIKGVATDNVGVTELHITVNGQELHANTQSARITYNWDTKKVPPGAYTISIIASDAAGNVGTASVKVKK